MTERTFTCLACEDRPVLHGKVAAALHLRDQHAALLETCHYEELLAAGPEYEIPKEHVGPYVCLYPVDDDDHECGGKRMGEAEMVKHLVISHEMSEVSVTYFEHYISEGDLGLREARLLAERDAMIERACDHFFLVMQSVDGVRDFLTECRA